MKSGIALTTTMFTIGGLISSIILGSNKVSSNFGRRFICIMNSIFFFVGSALMAFSNSELQINLGRFLNGIGSGLSLVISPILINELTPSNHRGLLGSSLQFAIVLGILLAQVISLVWSNEQQWRLIFVFASCLAIIQFFMLFTTVESPKWLILNQGDVQGATSILHNLRTDKSTVKHEINHWRRLSNTVDDMEPMESTSLLPGRTYMKSTSKGDNIEPGLVTTIEFLTNKAYRNELFAVATIMSSQQLCGINAINFYGASILAPVAPEGSNIPLLICCLTLCNVAAALVSASFVDKLRRRTLLLASTAGMGLSAMAIALGLIHKWNILAAISGLIFVISFATGLGPIPFIMTPEFTSHASVGPAQSVGSAINWFTNMTLAYTFPIAQNYIGGNVFYVFFFINLAYIVCISKLVPETLGCDNHDMVWKNYS